MIQLQTRLQVADNSGAREIQCIRILGTSNPMYASVGDRIIGVVKDALPNMAVKKSDVVQAVVVRVSQPVRRPNGMWIEFDDHYPSSSSSSSSSLAPNPPSHLAAVSHRSPARDDARPHVDVGRGDDADDDDDDDDDSPAPRRRRRRRRRRRARSRPGHHRPSPRHRSPSLTASHTDAARRSATGASVVLVPALRRRARSIGDRRSARGDR